MQPVDNNRLRASAGLAHRNGMILRNRTSCPEGETVGNLSTADTYLSYGGFHHQINDVQFFVFLFTAEFSVAIALGQKLFNSLVLCVLMDW